MLHSVPLCGSFASVVHDPHILDVVQTLFHQSRLAAIAAAADGRAGRVHAASDSRPVPDLDDIGVRFQGGESAFQVSAIATALHCAALW